MLTLPHYSYKLDAKKSEELRKRELKNRIPKGERVGYFSCKGERFELEKTIYKIKGSLGT